MASTRYSVRFFALFAMLLPAFLWGSLSARGQSVPMDECSGGTYYVLAFPDTTSNTWDIRFPSQLIRSNVTAFTFYIYSPVDQLLEIGTPGRAGSNVPITAGRILEYDARELEILPVTVTNTPMPSTISIRAEYPVIVYAYMLTPFGAEAFTPIPVDSWGTEYYTAQWPGQLARDVYPKDEFNYRPVSKAAPAEILIVAAYDKTEVTITPAGLLDCVSCQKVTLKRGEAYLVQSVVDTGKFDLLSQEDIGGTFIQASKPIGVISGNTRLMLNAGQKTALAENSFKNLAVEWISPVEQHGTEFVFLPTWDDRRQREGLELDESRGAEFVRIFGTGVDKKGDPVSVGWYTGLGDTVPAVATPLRPGESTQEKIGIPIARFYKTNGPAFAVSSPESVVKFNGTTTYGANYVGAAYLSWSTHMVELVPREQWTSFAPVRAPSLPSAMVHYLNLVTDIDNQFNVYYRQGASPAQLFPFNRGKVAGTELIWGSIRLNQGVDYIIEGDNGARFSGYVYGSYRGQEQFRPGRTEEGEGKGGAISGGESGDPMVLHPSEYEEEIALMYGYPLAPSRCLLLSADEYQISTKQECEAMEVTVMAANASAVGIRSVMLLPDSSDNVRLEAVQPASLSDLQSEKVTDAVFRLTAINPLRDAHGVLIITDRTRQSKRWRVAYNWEAERVDIAPAEVNFSEVMINTPAGERLVTITNPLPTANLVVRRLWFALGTQGFFIKRTDPDFDWQSGTDSAVLKPGQSLRVWTSILPNEEKVYVDSLRVQLGCVAVTVPMQAATALPCLYVGDLDFGTMSVGAARTLSLEICNKGKGSVTFGDPWLTWLKDLPTQQGFSVEQSEIDKLKGQTLAAGDCLALPVSFAASGPDAGSFRTTARFWGNTRNCRDTSVWKANVIKPGPQIDGYDWHEQWLSENPCTKNPIPHYRTTIKARNAGDAPFEIVGLEITDDPDNVFALGATTITSGIVMQPNDERDIEVIFDPREEKVYYASPAHVRLSYRINLDGKDSVGYVEGTLEGIGIESYIGVSDRSFGTVEFVEGKVEKVSGSTTLTAGGRRPVNIDRIFIEPGSDYQFTPEWAAANAWALQADGDVRTMDPGSELTVDVMFAPQNATPAEKLATINVVGDFAYDHCSPSDSSGTFSASVYALGATAEGVDFGTLLTCYEEKGVIVIRNTSPRSVQITGVSQVAPATMVPYFALDIGGDIRLPYTLAPKGDLDGKDVVRIPVQFTPNGAGNYAASVEVTVMNIAGTNEVAVLTVPLGGKAQTISAGMSIRRDHHGLPGMEVEIPIMLDIDPASAEIGDFILDIDYDEAVLSLGEIKPGDLLPESEGWHLEIVSQDPGGLTVRMYNTSGRFLIGKGTVLVMSFVPLAGKRVETEIPFNVTPVVFGENLNRCVEITTSPGHFTMDILKTSELISVIGITPNPLKDKGVIKFALRERRRVQIGVYTADGRRAALLFEGEKGAGIHNLDWDAAGLIKGAYYVQIKAGDETASWGVRIIK